MLKVRFSENANNIISEKNGNQNYFDLFDTQFIDIYMPSHRQYTIVHENEPADICILGTQHTDNSLLREDELNIFFTVENFSVGRRHYQHLNKFGRDENHLVKLYIYNDIINPAENMIPAIYQRIKYYNKLLDPSCLLYYESVRNRYNEINIPFNKKKFCLFISQNGLNSNKNKILNELSSIGQIDFLSNLSKTDTNLNKASCYNSFELLKTFNQYKFIICFENSKTTGYITEKIFNVFLAKSIPIYDGDPNISDFIYPGSFLQYDDKIIPKVKLMMNNEELYNNIINKKKTKELDYSFINENFDKLMKKYNLNINYTNYTDNDKNIINN
jgi:hypothetical protein